MSTLSVDTIQGQTTAANVKLPAGAVLQVVEGAFSTQVDMASSNYADTSLTVTITPKFASSKVFVITNLHMYINGTQIIEGKLEMLEKFSPVDSVGGVSGAR